MCEAGQDPATCLSEAEAGVVQRLHDGATDQYGRRLEQEISHEWGSELHWTLFVPAAQGQTVASEMFALSYLRYLADPNNPRPDYQLSDLQFTVRSFWETVLPSSTYMAALDPDLSDYRRSGGKLLLWHGWDDQHISPQNTLAYYDAMRETMGRRTVDRFTKLYLFPGMAHCGGGAGPNTTDVLTPVMAWVESGREPGQITASNLVDGAVTRTRPVYPYPTVARYDGSGEPRRRGELRAVHAAPGARSRLRLGRRAAVLPRVPDALQGRERKARLPAAVPARPRAPGRVSRT